MNVGEMKLTNLDMLGESTYDRFSEAEHLRWLNLALEDIAEATGYCRSEATWETTANEEEIPYPSDAVSIFRIEYNNEELEKTTRDELDEEDADWEGADTAAPEKWYPDRNKTYGIYPKPDDAYTLTVFYISVDDALSSDSSTPNIPTPYHIALCYFACAHMKRGDEDIDGYNSLMKDYYRVRSKLAKLKKKERNQTSGVRIKMADWSYD